MIRLSCFFLLTIVGLFSPLSAQVIRPHTWEMDLPLRMVEDQDGLQFTAPATEGAKSLRLSGFDTTSGQQVFTITLTLALRQPFRSDLGSIVPAGVYFCHGIIQDAQGKETQQFGRLTRTAGATTFVTGITLYNQGKSEEAALIFRHATQVFPTDSLAWMLHGTTLYKQFKQATDREQKARAAEAIQAYGKVLELTSDCRWRDNAIGYIATIYDEMGDVEQHRAWLLKRADESCATNEIKAGTFYAIGVKYWQCAYDLSTRYANQRRLNTEPFHPRKFTNAADKQQFEECVAKSFEYLEKALAINPEYAEAWSYKSLLYREKQKGTTHPQERRRFEAEAEKAAKLAIELTARAKSKQ